MFFFFKHKFLFEIMEQERLEMAEMNAQQSKARDDINFKYFAGVVTVAQAARAARVVRAPGRAGSASSSSTTST